MLIRTLQRIAVLAAVCLVTVLAVRAWDSQRGRPLDPWHTFVPDELTPAEIDRSDWTWRADAL